MHEAADPGLSSPTTRVAFTRLERAGLLPAEDAALLIRADHVWRTVQGMLRITYGRAPPAQLSPVVQEALMLAVRRAAEGVDAVDMAGLHATLDGLAQHVRACFIRYVGEIDP
jgi:glutamate-ammonia-ligase adenylyltransferase